MLQREKRIARCTLLVGMVISFLFTLASPAYADGGEAGGSFEVITYQITDLATSNPTQNSVDLTWTTPEARTHAFSYFDLRYSKATITSDNWDEAARATGEPVPVAGTSQGMKVRGLDSSTTYYFAIKLVDEEGLVGLLSNIARATTRTPAPALGPGPEPEPPAPPPPAPAPPIELAPTSPDSTATDTEGNELTVTPGFITITEEEETVTVSIPVALEEGATLASFTDPAGVTFADNRLVIPTSSMAVDGQPWFRIVDEVRDLQATLIIETGDAVGTGTAAVAEVKSIKADAQFTTKDFTPEDPSLGEVAATVDLDLNTIPEDAEVKIVASLEPEPEAESVFQLAATAAGMESVDIAYVINITLTNLENVTDIQSATIIMKAGTEWVETHGGVDVIRIVRYDPEAGEQQVLETHFLGYDEQGRAIFEGISPKGLSVFGLVGIAPKVAEFVISELVVTPKEVRVGETVSISVLVTNTGDESGSYEVTLKINGVVEVIKEVTVHAGFSKEVTFTISKDIASTYSVEVNGLTGSFTVKEELVPVVPPVVPVVPLVPAVPPVIPAAFTVSDLSISPSEVYIGETVSISVLVTNTGDESGSYEVALKINGVVEVIKEVTVHAGFSKEVTFTISKDIADTYSVEVDRLTCSFTVKEKPAPVVPVVPLVPPVIPKPINWPLIGGIIGGVIAVGLLVYFLVVRRRETHYYLNINLFEEISKWRISYSGLLLEAVDITSSDSKINIYIPEDTFCLNEKGNRLKGLVIKVEEEAPEPPKDCLILGKAYDIGPNGAAFDSYLRLTLAYEEEDIPEGVKEESLYIAYYGREWVPLDSTVDIERNRVFANAPHLTIFAIFGYLNSQAQ